MAKKISHTRQFSIDDAFEEEQDDYIRVYGSTTERSPLKPRSKNGPLSGITHDSIAVRIDEPNKSRPSPLNLGILSGNNLPNLPKLRPNDETASKDSDSLIHEPYSPSYFDPEKTWWHHPRVRENWKVVAAAFVLLFIGVGLFSTGVIVLLIPLGGIQGAVFLIAGAICFIPGAYHVVYIYLAVKGKRGYDFYHLPLFN